jgi:hypothetical protein
MPLEAMKECHLPYERFWCSGNAASISGKPDGPEYYH